MPVMAALTGVGVTDQVQLHETTTIEDHLGVTASATVGNSRNLTLWSPGGRLSCHHSTMNDELTPDTLGPPSANYALAMRSNSPGSMLHTSGIGPVRPDGSVPELLADQASTVWATIEALLVEADMAISDVVSVTTYVVAGNDLQSVMATRDASMAGHRCASTLVIVPTLADSSWKLEVAVVAVGP